MAIKHTAQTLVQINIDIRTPMIITEETAAQAGESAARIIRNDIAKALRQLSDEYDAIVIDSVD